MEFNPVMITVAGVILLILGIGAGWLLGSVGADEGEPEPGSAEAAPPGGRKGRYTPVAKLWREKKAGTLVVEMDGKAYSAPEGLTAAQAEQLEQSARDLRAFLGMGMAGMDAPAPAPVAAAHPPAPARAAAQPAAVPPASAASAAQAASAAPTAAPVPTASAASAAAPAPRPVTRATPPPPPPAPAKDKAAPAAKSIVMQIEDILQDMIAGTLLASRGLHLTEDPTRGVIVQLGLQNFEGIDAVTDPEAKAAIRAAVQTWENSAAR